MTCLCMQLLNNTNKVMQNWQHLLHLQFLPGRWECCGQYRYPPCASPLRKPLNLLLSRTCNWAGFLVAQKSTANPIERILCRRALKCFEVKKPLGSSRTQRLSAPHSAVRVGRAFWYTLPLHFAVNAELCVIRVYLCIRDHMRSAHGLCWPSGLYMAKK